MAMLVGPTQNIPTHDFTLSDGTTTLGFILANSRGQRDIRAGFTQAPMPRTAMKLSQGAAKYEDFELPFTSIIQESFEGGMLAEDIESDTSKYRDARYCDTTRGDVICGPKPTTTALVTSTQQGDIEWDARELDFVDITEGRRYASDFTPDADIDVVSISMNYFDILGHAKVGIYSDSGGSPDTQLGYGERRYITNEGIYIVRLDSTVSLTAGTTYWIMAFQVAEEATEFPPDPTIYGAYNYFRKISAGHTVKKYNGSSWSADTTDCEIAFYLNGTPSASRVRFFEHRRAMYAIHSYDDGTTDPKLFINGFRGKPSSTNSDLTKITTNQDLSEDDDGETLDLSGAVILIIEGPGSEEEQPWRVISSNTTVGINDVITVGEPWNIQPTTSSSFVILGTDDWFELSTTGLTGKVTDVCVVYNYVAIALGDSVNIRKFRWTNADGHTYTDDGSNKWDKLLMVADTEGNMQLWGADIDDNIVDYAPAQYYSKDHTFEDKDIKIGSSKYDDIKSLIAYGDPLIPYVIKENSFGSIENDIYAEVPLGELDEVRSVYNGIAAMKHGVYLYFNLGEMIERYYDRRLDDVGPNRNEGMPAGRNGIVRKLLPFPGRYYALIYSDGNVPSILCHNGMGWHEIWRPTSVTNSGKTPPDGGEVPFLYNVSDISGGRCNDMIVQTIPGDTIDRLWFDHNGELVWIPISLNPRKDSNYEYRDLSQIETAWIYGNLKDVNKYWHSIKLHTENLSGTDQSIKVEYKTDTDTSWTRVGVIDTSPMEELDLSSSYDVTGYRIKFRFTLHTADDDETPRILALVVKGVVRVDVKKGWNVTCIATNETDLTGTADTQSSVMSKLYEWADSDQTPAPLTLRHNISDYDNKKVFIEAPGVAFNHIKLNKNDANANREYQEILSFLMYEV